MTDFNLTETVGSPICPVDDYPEKPVEPEILLQRIKKLTASRNVVTSFEYACESTYTNHHKGTVKKYVVYDPLSEIEYGQFYYCEYCANLDLERGLIVKLSKE